jgi:hypothetical protein
MRNDLHAPTFLTSTIAYPFPCGTHMSCLSSTSRNSFLPHCKLWWQVRSSRPETPTARHRGAQPRCPGMRLRRPVFSLATAASRLGQRHGKEKRPAPWGEVEAADVGAIEGEPVGSRVGSGAWTMSGMRADLSVRHTTSRAHDCWGARLGAGWLPACEPGVGCERC